MKTDAKNFETTDKKPVHERKSEPEHKAGIGKEPDAFLAEHFKGRTVQIRRIWDKGTAHGYVILDSGQAGYFELEDGMSPANAEAAVNAAYGGQVVQL